jgi:polysaccharide biosynthesis transport protein
MKDNPFDPPGKTFIQSQNPGVGDLYPPQQNEEMILDVILSSVRKYWYVSILVSSLMMSGIIYKTAKEPRIYKSGIQIAIDLKDNSGLAEKIAGNAGAGSSEARTTNIETITQILKSKTIIQKAIDKIPDPQLRPSVDKVVEDLMIQSGQNTNILSITYKDTVPERVVAILSALSNTYIDYSIKTKKTRTDSSIAFIESQLPESRKRLDTSAQEVEKFRQKYKFIDPESSTKGLADYRQSITAKLNEVKVQYNQTQKQYEELKKQIVSVGLQSNNILSTTMLTQDSAYQELFKKLNEADLAYTQEKIRFSDTNPIVVLAKEKRDQTLLLLKQRAQQVLNRNVLDSELTNGGISNFNNSLAQGLANKQAETETNLASQSAQYQSLYKVYQNIEEQIAQLPTLQKQYTELQRQYTLHSQELTAFLQKLQELKISDAEQVVPWSLLDPPELPGEPISPNVKRQLGLGGFGSVIIGLLAAIGLKKLDNRIENPDIVKSITGMPILTLIPNVNNLEQNSSRYDTVIQSAENTQNYSYQSFVESIRTLALAIGFINDQEKNQEDKQLGEIIVMTSALPKEGKSLITFNTSIILSELGYRVLLVDVDLYKSTISRLCLNSTLFDTVDWDNNDGLSDVLLKGYQWENLIKKSPQLKLDVLPSGSPSNNSISLLNSPQFVRLIEQWKNEYDYVIFDTPPIVGVSDTRLISSLADRLIYIVNLNVANRSAIKRAVEIIASIQTPVVGLAINQVENHYSGYSDYYQYYKKPQ